MLYWAKTKHRVTGSFSADAHIPEKFEVLTALNMLILLPRLVTPCALVGRYQCSGGTFFRTINFPTSYHISIKSVLRLSFHLLLDLPSCPFPRLFSTKFSVNFAPPTS
jgi:hypothetical protein